MQSVREELARDLYALFVHIMKGGGADVFRAVAELELSLTQIKALHVLEATGEDEQSVKALADALGVSLPAMSRAVDGLLHRGFVERHEDAEDRRVRRVRATAAGLEVPRALHQARLSRLQDFIAGLGAEEAAGLARALAPVAARPDILSCRPTPEEAS